MKRLRRWVMGIAVAGMALYTIPSLTLGVYDMAVTGPCVDAIRAAVKVQEEAIESPYFWFRDRAVVANDLKQVVATMRDSIAAAQCPSYAAGAQADVAQAMSDLVIYYEGVSRGGPHIADIEEALVKRFTVALTYLLSELRALA